MTRFNLPARFLRGLACLMLVASSAFGITYQIPHGGIADHSNPSTTGSIAWYMATYGAGTYELASSTTYYCTNTIFVPANTWLAEAPGVNAIIRASTAWINDSTNYLIKLHGNSAMVRDLELDGDYRAHHIVYAASTSGNKVRDCTVHRSAKEPTVATHSVFFNACTNVEVTGSLLRRASCTSTELNFARGAHGIYVPHCNGVVIADNDIAVIASGGINFQYAVNVLIDGNFIHDTGRCATAGYIADGITGYHNGLGTTMRNVTISNNEVWESRNHGIHVSGYGITIENNKVWYSGLVFAGHNISVGDGKVPYDCSAHVIIRNNWLPNCPQQGGSSITVVRYKAGTITVAGNTGCTTTSMSITCD